MTRVLFLTVGTGDIADRRATLLEPLRKSIERGEYDRIVLIPSQTTQEHANVLKTELAGTPIEVRPLTAAGMEEDADQCLAFFDDLLASFKAQGAQSHEMLVDFTRGTKVMSAALLVAAIQHGLPKVRYITGQRDGRGVVIPGSEKVREFATFLTSSRQRFDQALQLFRYRNFAAVLELIPDVDKPNNPFVGYAVPQADIPFARFVRQLASFYGAWDRLNYSRAAKTGIDQPPRESQWSRFIPSDEVRQWVQDLAQIGTTIGTMGYQQRIAPMRRLAADLWANGMRRIRDSMYEDALLRAYRITELVGQIRLCVNNVDVFAAQLARYEVLNQLISRNDPFAKQLREISDFGQLRAADRNESVLVHGFRSQIGNNEQSLKEMYGRLEKLLLDESPAAKQNLALASRLDFS